MTRCSLLADHWHLVPSLLFVTLLRHARPDINQERPGALERSSGKEYAQQA